MSSPKSAIIRNSSNKIGMNICFVYDCEYPWDIRVEKICHYLTISSHKVSLVCRNQKAVSTYWGNDKFKIFRLPNCGKNFLTKLINITLFFNPFWIFKIYCVVTNNKCRLILVRDLPLAASGIIIGKIKRIPVVIDMAEPYPLTVRQRRHFEKFRVSHFLTRNFLFADIYEKFVINNADHIFTVCEEAKDRLINLGARSGDVTIVRNTPELEKFRATKPCYPGILNELKNNFIILYVGIIIGGRGVDLAIKALSEVSKIRTDIKLVIVGNGRLEKEMMQLTKDLDQQETVFFEGWVENNLVPQYMSSCDLGLLPFMNSQHMNHTLANKLFDFMAVGKPILCSDVKPMKRIINETRAGYLFEAESVRSLRDKILEIAENYNLAQRGKLGLVYAKKKYNWEIDKKNMHRALIKVIKECPNIEVKD